MFKFPSDAGLTARWLEKLGMLPDFVPKPADRVCHLHFSPQLIDFGEQSSRLKKGAIPGDLIVVHPNVREIKFTVDHCGKQAEVLLFDTAKVSTLKSNVCSLTGCRPDLKIKFLHREGFHWEAPEDIALAELELPIETKLKIVCPSTSPCSSSIICDEKVRDLRSTSIPL